MQHEVLAELAGERVDDLFVLAGAERGDDQRLCFAAREQRAAVRARQQPHLHGDRPDGARVAAVDALSLGEDPPAHDIFLDVLEHLVQTLEHQHLVERVVFGSVACTRSFTAATFVAPRCL